MIHHLVARLDVKPDAAFVDPNHRQNLGLHPFEHGFRVRGIAHGDLLCAYEGGVHKVSTSSASWPLWLLFGLGDSSRALALRSRQASTAQDQFRVTRPLPR